MIFVGAVEIEMEVKDEKMGGREDVKTRRRRDGKFESLGME